MSPCTTADMPSKWLEIAMQARRPMFCAAAVAALLVGSAGASAQSDSAIILAIPSPASAVRCSTSVARATGIVTVALTLAPRAFSDRRMVIGTFDTTGRPLTLRDAGFRTKSASIESATVQFDSTGLAAGGLGQFLTPEDFTKDSTGALHPRLDRPAFRRLTRAQLGKAQQVSGWLWQRECRSANPPNSEGP